AQQHRDPDCGHGQIKTDLESHGALLAVRLGLVLVWALTSTAPEGGLRSGSRADQSNAAERFRHISMHSPLPPATASAACRVERLTWGVELEAAACGWRFRTNTRM